MKNLLVLAFFAVVVTSAQANLISNGGFETGDFTGWWTWAEEPANQTVTVVDTLASEGTYSAESVSATGTWSARFGQWFAVPGGGDLTLSFDYYAVTEGWGTMGVNLDYYDAGGNKHWLGWYEPFTQSSAPVEGQWVHVDLSYTLPEGTTALDLKVEVVEWATINFDNFSAVVVPEPATLVLLGLGAAVLGRRRRV